MNKKLSRRDFLKVTGVTPAGLALSACGVKATETPTLTATNPPSPLRESERRKNEAKKLFDIRE